MNYIKYIEYAENTYQLTLPSLYKQLAKDNMLDWQLGLENWHKDIYPNLLKNPPLLLCAYEFEMCQPNSILEMLGDILPSQDDDNDFYVKDEYQNRLVIFAECGNGDYYAFYYENDKHSEPQIIRICHDDDSEFVAKNLQEFIFFKLLEIANVGDNSELETFRENLLAQLRTHTPYLTNEQVDCLKNIYTKEFQKDNHGYWVLLNNTEFDNIINDFIPYEKQEQSFELYEFE